MPMYRYCCRPCKWDTKKLMSAKEAEAFSGACPWCGIALSRVISNPNTQAKETLDEYRGSTVDADINQKVEDRAKEHFRKHDLPRIIADHGIEFAKRNGFVDEDGNPK